MKIGKYEFKDKETAESKIKGLGTSIDENGNEYPTHPHTVVKLGRITLVKAEYDEQGKEIKAAVLSDKYHLDVLFKGIDNHPYGWKSSAVGNIDNNGVHSFYGVDYLTHKF